MSIWRDFPKLELHLHLEGAAPPPLVRNLAAEKNIDLSDVFDEAGCYNSNDFTSFLRAYERVSTVFTTPDDYCALAEAVLQDCAAHGVIYAEVFLSPTSFGYDAAKWADYLAAVDEAADRVETTTGVITRFIPVAIRHHDPAQSLLLAEAVTSLPRGRIVGFGMAGDERMHAPRDYVGAFSLAAEAGLRLTAHAGEFGGPESVRAVLDDLKVERVGHGVRAAEDADLMRRLAVEGQVLEVCPGSNVALGVYGSLDAHPIASLLGAGVRCTVSTDDPPFFHTDMTAEYDALQATFLMDADAFTTFARTALSAAFCDERTKANLSARLDKALATPS